MKKNTTNANFLIRSPLNTDTNIDLIKTTNINILLNRVRLDKKKNFKKKLFLVFLLALTITCVVFFAII